MDIRRRFERTVFVFLLTASLCASKIMEFHGKWEDEEVPGHYNFHATCTYEIETVKRDFIVDVSFDRVPQVVTTWSLQLDETENSGDGFFRYMSNITAYPPRLVLTFHIQAAGPEPFEGICFSAALENLRLTRPIRPVIRPGPGPGIGPFPELTTQVPMSSTTQRHPCEVFLQERSTTFGRRGAFNGKAPLPPPSNDNLKMPPRNPVLRDLLDRWRLQDNSDSSQSSASSRRKRRGFRPGTRPLPRPEPEPTDAPVDQDMTGPLTNYAESVGQSLLFYAIQRSGQLPANALLSVPWQSSSATADSGNNGEDLSGGWYNGNAYVKFNFPMAASTTLISMSFHEWGEIYTENDLTAKLLETIKWPLDYFLKCWSAERQELYVQVGDMEADDQYWGRPETMTYERRAFLVSAETPGSDVASEMAAAMAISSLVFRDTDGSYADQLLKTAKEIYTFAKTYTGKYSDFIPEAAEYYPSSGYADELCLAATMLYKASGEEEYLNDSEAYFNDDDISELSWDKKNVLAAVYLYDITGDALYEQTVARFLTSWTDPVLGDLQYTPDGLAWFKSPGPLRYTANAAFLALLAIHKGIDVVNHPIYNTWSEKQIAYMLGDNQLSRSYQIGVGQHYPVKPEHKMSSCPLPPDPCGHEYHTNAILSGGSNLYTLFGALVGGPDVYGNHIDEPSYYEGNDVAIDYNAGFTAAVAGLYSLSRSHEKMEEICKDYFASKEMSQPTPSRSTWSTTWTFNWTPDWFKSSPSLSPSSSLLSTAAMTKPTAPRSIPVTFNYSDALAKSILFYKAQRSGIFNDGDSVPWRIGFSGTDNKLDHAGGWYDDGSAVKTTLVTASSVALLGWGYLKFEDGYQAAGQIEAMRDCLRWPLDYLQTSWKAQVQKMVSKVGLEPMNRAFWSRPEKQDRDVFKIKASLTQAGYKRQGVDIAADTASALAIGSIIFKSDAEYAANLLNVARELYEFAKNDLEGALEDEESVFYKVTNGVTDELCLASLWLYKATGERSYLDDAETFVFNGTITYSLDYQDKQILCQILMREVTGDKSSYDIYIKNYLNFWAEDKNKDNKMRVNYTMDGLAWYNQNAPLRSAANSAFIALLAADMGLEPEKHRNWALSQIQYMLGRNKNAFSYQIGYGERYPLRPHHRASSCPDEMESCDWSIYNDPSPNQHLLTGALVGGPDLKDYHEDCRANYTMNRVAIDYNAGFQSALAGILKYDLRDPLTTSAPSIATHEASGKPTMGPVTRPAPDKLSTDKPAATTKKPTKPTTRPKSPPTEVVDSDGGTNGSSFIISSFNPNLLYCLIVTYCIVMQV